MLPPVYPGFSGTAEATDRLQPSKDATSHPQRCRDDLGFTGLGQVSAPGPTSWAAGGHGEPALVCGDAGQAGAKARCCVPGGRLAAAPAR